VVFNHSHIAKISRKFWSLSRIKFTPGADIVDAVNLLLPIDMVNLPELTLSKVNQWLSERHIFTGIEADERSLHGFILTHAGSGIMFLNETDTEEERRYTVAHEASHFILDYKMPRDRAIKKLGPKITEVLDGYREPTKEERVDGFLRSIVLAPFTHLLEKTGNGSFSYARVYDAEINADALAVEMLAPQANVIKALNKRLQKTSFSDFRERCKLLLINNYRLPASIAKEYSLRLTYIVIGPPSLLDKLGL